MSKAHDPNVPKPQRVLVVGLGTMGMSHARAYQAIEGFELVGLYPQRRGARRSRQGVPRRSAL
jgi:NAD-dependent oxidoreductase involved in siderophore biosynthesis